ncbi:FAD-dependent 5-carboxymethylaminomethyl-2-thiouridine(34) oxidoreductase MnmC [Massilia endophytica]|uniref:FAD-dependent 5-carboxymethylaminomethyl-2-thiouridine(34) oxidoreductase MnmC n=1 Tax=Massilia endophytica TaxID=2899220 RepID=UPI001E4F9656|nr:FAD-dependent 5-carboxymethylaminomethyl-2-thiouridine(34) oxidoreductase MnmC [Massilia endophytica]UGQ46863.1 FAD-dependent 5-carboxymethylaminomethyl-2-thiouridine(34) oxidoreductase MnmC [Massilia endophytica]
MQSASASLRKVVLDLAFGQGEHFARARKERRADETLHYIAPAPSMPPPCAPGWPSAVPGMHRLHLDGGAVTLDLLIGDQASALGEIAARADHFIVDGPVPQPRLLGRLAAPGATLQARSPDDATLRALRSAGFAWPEQQDEWLHAVYASRRPQAPAAPPPSRRAIVVGAGLAGAAACERLCARGWEVTLVERHGQAAQEASGNRAGIFMPLLSKDDNIPTRLTRAAYLYAMRRWQALGGFGGAMQGAQCGVLQLARDAEHAQLQEELVKQWNYPPEFVRWLDPQAASAVLGSATPSGAWLFPQGGWANPASICRAMLEACGGRLQRRFHSEAVRIERRGGEWAVLDAGGRVLAQAPDLVLANGAGALALPPTAPLPLYTMRGQVTHLPDQRFPALPMVVCREAYMTPPVDGIVSVGATYDSDGERALRASSQEENLARAEEILSPGRLAPHRLDEAPLAGRVGFRCMAPDRLPLAGTLPDYGAHGRPERLRDVPRHPGLHCLLGYASRGLIWAPLMAELLASQLEGEPLPLEAGLAAALDPARFLLKDRRRSVAATP